MKEHGNKGNKNSEKEVKNDAVMILRMNSAAKSRFAEQAKKDGLTLSKWVIKMLVAACDETK